MKSSKLAGIVLAAGKGTRMRSERAKVLHEICGRPLVHYAVRAAIGAGANPVVAVVGHQAGEVEVALRGAFDAKALRFALQKQQKGTADAVLAAEPQLKGHRGPVLILSGDAPLITEEVLSRLAETREQSGSALAFLTVTLDDPTGYGRVVRDPGGKPARIVEEKDASAEQRRIREVNAGFYCADPAFLWEALGQVDNKNRQKELYLTDLVAMAAAGPGVVAVEARPSEAAGVNDRAELARARRAITGRIAAQLLADGVTIEDPDRFDCDDGVEVGVDTVIEPAVRLRGATRIGPGCIIGQGSILIDATLGKGVTVRPYSLLEEASVATDAVVGPFARLRPGTTLAEGSHVGNFVELKKTALGKGSKANHLTYLGDAEIGDGVNIGAGTITCNYDGEKKHPTRIGDGAFVGSDATLVAPVELGKNAYVGAGSTITDDVPAGALAIGRGRQVVKAGWVAKRSTGRGKK
jgi:bifunctional UDP-N-acetylglucosamine pyrophosphorylase/glucosamine-1-phosphate N-acetyltransferase